MKTICIYNPNNLSSLLGAAIVKQWFLLNNKENRSLVNDLQLGNKVAVGENSLTFSRHSSNRSVGETSEYEQIILCGITFPPEIMLKLHRDKDLIWINSDQTFTNLVAHHQVEIGDMETILGYHNKNFSVCELTWAYFFGYGHLPEIVQLIGLYDSKKYKNFDNNVEVVQFWYGAKYIITTYEEAYYWLTSESKDKIQTITSHGVSIYQYLCIEAKQIYKTRFSMTFTGVFPVNGTKAPNDDRTLTYSFICINHKNFNPIDFGIDYHADGYDVAVSFYYSNNRWNFSLYNENGQVNCHLIAKQFNGNGIKSYASFILKDINTFMEIRK